MNAGTLLAITASLAGGLPGLRGPERDRPPPEHVQRQLVDKAAAKRARKAAKLQGGGR